MATITKDFKIKSGLVVEGSTATVAGNDVLTKSQNDQEYIVDLIGGTATPNNTPDTVVKRDSNGDFAAGDITAVSVQATHEVTVGNDGTSGLDIMNGDLRVYGNQDIRIQADNGGKVYIGNNNTPGSEVATKDDVNDQSKIVAAELLVNATLNNITITKDGSNNLTITAENGVDDATTDNLDEGLTNKYFTAERVKDVLTASTQTNIVIQEIAGELHITAENGVDESTTDNLVEGSTNKYYSDSLVDNHLSGGNGINYSSGTISANLTGSGGLGFSAGGKLEIDRTTVDTWYDASGAAQTAQSNAESTASGYVSTHSDLTTGVHGVNGDVVGTSDTQTLTNKTIGDVLTFNDGSNNSTIDVDGNNLYVNANNDLTLSTANGDIVLNPDGNAYIGSASAGNLIATNSYVDNAVSGLAWKQSVNLLYDAAIPVLSGSGASQLIIDGHAPLGDADSGYRVLITQSSDAGIYVFNSTSGNWTLTRAADADTYSELIGAAVYVMEGTQYGSTSWVQGDHYITSFAGQDWTQFSGQGSVTAGTGITVNGLEVSVNRTTVDSWYDAAGDAADAEQAAKDYADGLASNYDPAGSAQGAYNNAVTYVNGEITTALGTAQGYADTAETDAKSYADSLATNYDAAGSATTAENNANSYTDSAINNLDTDDIEEGITNHYYTDTRAKTAAANLLTNSTLSNITITGDQNGLVITAENGVAGSTTDELQEGSSNLYFTNARAQSAVAGDISSAINALDTDDIEEGTSNLYFTNERASSAVASDISTAIETGSSVSEPTYQAINFGWMTKQVGAYLNVPTAGSATVYEFPASYASAKFIVRVRNSADSQVSELLLTRDNSNNVAVTEYAIVLTNNELATVSADYSNGNIRLRVQTNNSDTEVIASGTLMSYGD